MTKQSVRFSLGDMYPNLEQEQLHAIGNNLPIPPSRSWLALHGHELTAPAPTPSETGLPLVSCVLVVNAPKAWAQRAVQLFLGQTYSAKQLVIVNTTDRRITTVEHPDIVEKMIDTPLTLGAMRNVGLDTATGAWIKQWAPNEYYDPHFLSYLMAHRREGMATALKLQLRTSLVRGSAYLHPGAPAVENTLLVPRSTARYLDTNHGEDVIYYREHWATKCLIVPNITHPATTMNIAIYSSDDVAVLSQAMPYFYDDTTINRWILPEADRKPLEAVLLALPRTKVAGDTGDTSTVTAAEEAPTPTPGA